MGYFNGVYELFRTLLKKAEIYPNVKFSGYISARAKKNNIRI